MAQLPPVFKSSLDLDTFVDPPLHLVALGVLKTTIRVIGIWISNRGRKSQFLKLVRQDLYHIKHLDLDWCEVYPKTFGAKFGGYISDNYMALGRICHWLYSSILLLREPDPYQEPTTPVDKWYVKDCRQYLTIRGLKIPKYVAEMRLAVTAEMNKIETEKAEVIIPPTCTAIEAFECVTRMYLLLTHLFQEWMTVEQSVKLLHAQIWLFLSAFDCLDMATRTSRTSVPRWVTSYNFMCLLNIPGMVEKYGPYKGLYEGRFCGEGYNRILKPCANRTSHRNRCVNILRNLTREKSMEAVQHNFDNESENTGVPIPAGVATNRTLIYRMAHRYKNKNKLQMHYNKNYPLSVLIYKLDNEQCFYGICYIHGKDILINPIERLENTEIVVGKFVKYWKWKLICDVGILHSLESVVVIDFGLLLPLTSDPTRIGEISPGHYYGISTHSWNSLNSVLY